VTRRCLPGCSTRGAFTLRTMSGFRLESTLAPNGLLGLAPRQAFLAAGSLPNMRMQLTRPRVRWSKAGRPSNASLQLIRGR